MDAITRRLVKIKPVFGHLEIMAQRILRPGGIFRMNVPFVFFDEPTAPTLDTFIRVTASYLFPELGIFEGEEIQSVFSVHFAQSGIIDIFPGYAQFWGIKY